MEALPSDPVHAGISPLKCIFNFHSFSEEGWSSRSTTESKNQAEASQAAAKAGKRCRAAKTAKLNSIPALKKNDFDNLPQHQKDKDVLGSEISDLKDTLSVT